jgi:carbamoyltransferase
LSKAVYILGLSAYYHDSAAALLKNGTIIAAAQEERFTRVKHDAAFPKNAIDYCLQEAGIELDQITHVVFYDKPLLKFERILETYLSYAPKGFSSFLASMPVWLKEKLFLKTTLAKELSKLSGLSIAKLPKLYFTQHHQSHAASAFFPSPFKKAAVLCLDGVGEWATSSLWLGEDNKLTPLWEIDFPHSLGLLYSAFTYFTGFKVNSGEYKLMGLAPYGEPKYVKAIIDNLIDIKPDGTFRLNMMYFNYATGLSMTNHAFAKLFGGPARKPESEITQREMDLAASIQVVTEQIVQKLAHTAYTECDTPNLCLAGGVALNCVSNGKLLRNGPFMDIWVQPAAGDAGGALGAALSLWYDYLNQPRNITERHTTNLNNYYEDSMKGGYLGPEFTTSAITEYLDKMGAKYDVLSDSALNATAAELLSKSNVIGWFQGRMEFGPRALGARSIIGDARSPKMQSTMNLKIKYRESFRPFAPVVKADKVSDWFEHNRPSPYMLMVSPIHPSKQISMTETQQKLFGIEKLKVPRSTIPAVTHVDNSARVQTVHPETNPKFYDLLDKFEQLTGCPVLINTSFNVRGEPIVCTPEDAYRCFMRTEMDYLVLENVILNKKEQPLWEEEHNWKEEFALD